MQCPCPISLPDPRGTTTAQRLNVPCGKCPVCLAGKRADWSFRLNEELKSTENAYFITLTYDDEKIPLDGTLNKRDIQLFNKRLRKKTGDGMRFFLAGEYGSTTHRPHYHGIYFNVKKELIEDITSIWGQGHCHTGTATPASIHYTTKYIINFFDWDKTDVRLKPFVLMSRNPAIGHAYLKRNGQNHYNNMSQYVVNNGHLQKLPKYYKERIFTASDRERLAEETKLIAENKWLVNYDQEWRKTTNAYIENKFRQINKLKKSL